MDVPADQLARQVLRLGGAAAVPNRQQAGAGGLTVWALTGPAPNPACELADDAVCVDAPATATIQEVHQVVVHLLCAAVDVELGFATAADTREAVRR